MWTGESNLALINDAGERLDIVRLWILRILVPLGGLQKFITDAGFKDDCLARYIGLKGLESTQSNGFKKEEAIEALRALHNEAERSLVQADVPDVLRENVNKLSPLVGLDDTDRRILEFIVILRESSMLFDATEMLGDLSLRRLYRAISVLVGQSEEKIRKSLSINGKLLGSGLVAINLESSVVFADKLDLISQSFHRYMLSDMENPIALLRDVISACGDPDLSINDYSHIRKDHEVLIPYIRKSIREKSVGVNVFVYGLPGTGKSQFARVLAREIGCNLFEVALEDEYNDPVFSGYRFRPLRVAQSLLNPSNSILLFDDVDDVFLGSDSPLGRKSAAGEKKGWLNRILETNKIPTVWVGNSIAEMDPAVARRFDYVLEIPVPPKRQREKISRELCQQFLSDNEIVKLSKPRLVPAVVERAAKVIGSVQKELSQKDLGARLSHIVNNTLILQGGSPIRFDDSNSIPDWYDPLFINSDMPLIEIMEGLERSRCGRLCLYGPPGTGKSAFGYWLSEMLDMPLLIKRASDLYSMFLGGTEKNIAQAFQDAESDGAILLIDEMDSFLQNRGDANFSWEITIVNEMLTRIEGFNGVLISTTNLLDTFDTAAIRRFDVKIKFDYLSTSQAWSMFQRLCPSLGLNQITTDHKKRLSCLSVLTPGDFATVVRLNRFRSVKNPDMLLDALENECVVKGGIKRHPMGFL